MNDSLIQLGFISLVLGFGGTLKFGYGSLKVAGTLGGVLIVLGALF